MTGRLKRKIRSIDIFASLLYITAVFSAACRPPD